MGEYTGELTYSSKKCGQCLFNPPCLICDFEHEDLIKWEPVVIRFSSEYRKRGHRTTRTKRRSAAEVGHALLDNDDSESRQALEGVDGGLPGITSDWSEQMGNREEKRDDYDPNV